jgi:glucose/arabinose dehydrogenase
MRFLTIVCIISVVACVAATRKTRAETPQESDYYKITTFETPPGEVIEVGGFQLMPNGSMAVCSRRGDIFMIADPFADNVTADQFSVYARGLHEPLSLAFRDGWLYATQRGEVTRMRDTDDDGRADEFETVADGWGISTDYHEYAFGSKFDEDGNLVVTLCLTGSFSSKVPFRGWAMKITPDGQTVPMTSGVRSPGGVGADAQGQIYYTDNQGPWNGTCALKPLREGKFVGHPGGFQWYSLAKDSMGEQPPEPESGSRMVEEADRIDALDLPAVLFPYNKMGKSASGIACDTTGGKFGPFKDQLFVGDQSASTIMRVFLENIDGQIQGVCFPFRSGFASGNVGVEMTPQGSLFVGGTNRGWGSVGREPFAVERLDWTGKVPFEMLAMRLKQDGFELEFTKPVDPTTASDPNAYSLQTYTYEYRSQYGSPEVDHTRPKIKSATVSADGMKVRLVIDGLQRGHVHELVCDKLKNASGEPLLHPEAYYTLNQFVE